MHNKYPCNIRKYNISTVFTSFFFSFSPFYLFVIFFQFLLPRPKKLNGHGHNIARCTSLIRNGQVWWRWRDVTPSTNQLSKLILAERYPVVSIAGRKVAYDQYPGRKVPCAQYCWQKGTLWSVFWQKGTLCSVFLAER